MSGGPAVAFTAEELAARVARTRSAMRERGLAALCVAGPENVYYLLGLNHQGYFAFTLLLLPLEGEPLLVTRAMERPTVEAQAPGCVHVPFGDGEDPAAAAARAVRKAAAPGDRVGVERASMYLPVAVWERLRASLDGLDWADGSGIVDAVRAVKSPAEIACMRRAAAISDQAMQAAVAAGGAGVSDRQVAAAVYHRLLQAGSDHPGIVPLIRPREVLLQEHLTGPHDRLLAAGDELLVELSASVGRYHAPLSRMLYLGRVPAGAERVAEVALGAQEAVRAALRPGAVTGEVYAAWQRAVDQGLGHPRYRRHNCGYLVGIGFQPSWVGGGVPVGIRDGSDLVVAEGMTFHVLSWLLGQGPADYVVSDTILVTPAGGELLTTTPRHPLVVP
ncbi:MAG TPA: Xaa-Pro peptidase family protein [Actinomycetes bacterium]|jgi:Xaa-Pro dipeptidase|nr:Xaa-Pro peptidase family protein [Actinomycetes bacterium]